MKSWFLLVDKPLNWTSFDLVAFIRKKIWVKKVGHTWTLDPLATGLMLIWVWEWTKLLSYHTHDKKSYKAKIKFWYTSETYDSEWPIKKTNFLWKISKQQLFEAVESFKWKIKQTPPKFSALKIEWQKLCDLARKGHDVKIPEREVEIFKIEILSFEYPDLELEINCSSWTYIRSIANDLWKKLWPWAYLSWLIRTWIEDLELNQAISNENVSEKDLLPLDFGLNFERLEISEEIEKRLKQGQRIWKKDLEWSLENWRYLIYSKKDCHPELIEEYFSIDFIWIWKFENWVLRWEKILNYN